MDETPLFPGFCWLILTWNTYKSNSDGTFTFFVTRQLLFSRPSVPKHYRKSERWSNSQKFRKTTVAKPLPEERKTVEFSEIRENDRRISKWKLLQKQTRISREDIYPGKDGQNIENKKMRPLLQQNRTLGNASESRNTKNRNGRFSGKQRKWPSWQRLKNMI